METLEAFRQLDIRTGTILTAEEAVGTAKPFYKITADFGSEVGQKTTVAGLPPYYTKEELVGKTILGVTNLPPTRIGPYESHFLILAVQSGNTVSLLTTDRPLPPGLKVL